MKNRVKELLAKGEPAFGCWLSIPSPTTAEIVASSDIDWALVDTEHAPTSLETFEDLLRALKGSGITPLVRVAGNDPVRIKQAFDRGAYGVLIPFVNDGEEARAAVRACKYPPEGIRGIAGTRANAFGSDLKAYFESWNDQVLVAVQIETEEALENLEEIASVPGIDVLFIGPNDLSASLGIFQQFDHPKFLEAVGRVLEAADSHGIAAGYMASGIESTLAKIKEGFRFVAMGTDARLLANAVRTTADQIREGIKGA